MSDYEHDNMKDLFESFVDPKRARKAVEDVHAADEIMRKHPAPEPGLELILKIKAQGIAQMQRRKRMHIWRKYAVEMLAAVAVLSIVASVGLKLFQNGTPKIETFSAAIWETYDLKKDDPTLAQLGDGIEQIEQQFRAIQSTEEETSNTYDEVSELEMELSELEGEFWKG